VQVSPFSSPEKGPSRRQIPNWLVCLTILPLEAVSPLSFFFWLFLGQPNNMVDKAWAFFF